MKQNFKRKLLAGVLSVCMIFQTAGMAPVYAVENAADSGTSAGASAVCENHTEHDEACGYVVAVKGSPCTHTCELCAKDGKEDTEETKSEEITDNTSNKCICTGLCEEDNVNENCTVCKKNYEDCAAEAESEEESGVYSEAAQKFVDTVAAYDKETIVQLAKAYVEKAKEYAAVNNDTEAKDEDKQAALAAFIRAEEAFTAKYDAVAHTEASMYDVLSEEDKKLTNVQAAYDALKDITGTVEEILAVMYQVEPLDTVTTWNIGAEGNEMDVTATLSNSGETLTISGSGAMKDWGPYDDTAPWRGNDKIKTVVIENGVTNIGTYAFYVTGTGSTGLTNVTIPESVTKINSNAFDGCQKLQSLVIPDSVTEIGDTAFQSTGLTKVTLPKNLKTVGSQVFNSCQSLEKVTIPEGVEMIGETMFQGDKVLTNISIPASVKNIGALPFNNCTALKSIELNFSNDNNTKTIEDTAFYAITVVDGSVIFGPRTTPITVKAVEEGGYSFTGWSSTAEEDGGTAATFTDQTGSTSLALGDKTPNKCTITAEYVYRSVPTVMISPDKGAVTYGETVTLTARVGKNGSTSDLAGTVQFKEGTTLIGTPVAINENGEAALEVTKEVLTYNNGIAHSFTAEFIPASGSAYRENTSSACTVTVAKAKPVGEPGYTKVAAGGKTLADAALTTGSITPAGTITWDLADTTAVVRGTAYHWTFTPSDSANYENLTGEMIPWEKGTNNGGGSSGGSSSGGGSSSSGESSSGGSSSSGSNSTPTDTPTTGKTEIKVDVDKSGNAIVSITDKAVADAIKQAQDAAKKNGTEKNGISVVINVTTNKDADTISVTLPKSVQEQLTTAKVKEFKIVSKNVEISLNQKAIQHIKATANADVTITAAKVDGSKLSKKARTALGGRPVYDFKATYVTTVNGKQKTNTISQFGSGSVSIAIPYTLGAKEKAGNLYAVYIDDKGKVTYITNSSYDVKTGKMIFGINHFSYYGIGYKADTKKTKFADIAGHWAENDIEFVAARGLLAGTKANTFSPNLSMTRGMFVTALGRLAGAEVSSYEKSSFTDVKADTYYMGYVEWANSKGIVKGTSATTFAPDQAVTREEMAVMMANYAKAIGYTMPKTNAEITFSDSGSISTWAKDSVKSMQMAGIIMEKDNNRFDPKGAATRAEVSAVLHRFVELVIDTATTQGWTKNDSGHWLYYKDGVMLAGKWIEVDGKWYYLKEDGTMAANTTIDGYEVDGKGVRKEK